MKRILTIFAAVAALAAGIVFAQAPAATTQAPAPRAAARQRIIQALNLTDAQKTQAKTIFQQTRQQTQPVRDQLKQNRQALAAAVKANDTNQIQQLSQAQGSLLAQMVGARAQARAQLYSMLTPDQRTKADQIAARIKARLQQRAARSSSN
jgi:Spy/CpxP family protein refolding chaperone